MYEAHPKFVRESVDKERDVAYNKNTDTEGRENGSPK